MLAAGVLVVALQATGDCAALGDVQERAQCVYAANPSDVAIDFDENDVLLGSPWRFKASLVVDRDSGLFRMDNPVGYLDPRVSSKHRGPAVYVGPIDPAWDPTDGVEPANLQAFSRSFVTASAYSRNWPRIMSILGKPDADLIYLNGERNTQSHGIVAARSGTPWGHVEISLLGIRLNAPNTAATTPAAGGTRYSFHSTDGMAWTLTVADSGLPTSATYFDEQYGDISRVRVDFGWGPQVVTPPDAQRSVTIQDFIRVKQSVDWKSVLSMLKVEARSNVCINADPSTPQPIDRHGNTPPRGFRHWVQRVVNTKARYDGWPAPFQVRFARDNRKAVFWFKDPVSGKRHAAGFPNPLIGKGPDRCARM